MQLYTVDTYNKDRDRFTTSCAEPLRHRTVNILSFKFARIS